MCRERCITRYWEHLDGGESVTDNMMELSTDEMQGSNAESNMVDLIG